MNKQIITADHLNATHLGKRITINSKHGTVMSGKLKKSAPAKWSTSKKETQ